MLSGPMALGTVPLASPSEQGFKGRRVPFRYTGKENDSSSELRSIILFLKTVKVPLALDKASPVRADAGLGARQRHKGADS